MAHEDTEFIEPWLSQWCRREAGAGPIELLLAASVMSDVRALRLEDGREVVIKARPDPTGRVSTCLAVQRAVAEAGLPCARPLTEGRRAGELTVHAEEWRPGGEIDRSTDAVAAERSARLYAAVTAVTSRCRDPAPLPAPERVRWDHDGPGHWPPDPHHDQRPGTAWLPEAALVGAASGAFASAEAPTLAPLESSSAFLEAYQDARGAAFTREEAEVAWAASLWPALHNARGEILWGQPPLALTAVLEQADARLEHAAA